MKFVILSCFTVFVTGLATHVKLSLTIMKFGELDDKNMVSIFLCFDQRKQNKKIFGGKLASGDENICSVFTHFLF